MTDQDPHALLTGVRLRPGADPVDARIRHGVIEEIGPHLDRAGAQHHDAGGALVIPGLWDAHVHFGQWAAMTRRVDVSDTAGPEEVTARIARHIAESDLEPGAVVQGFGWRVTDWDRLPTTAELDAAAGDHPVVLISGDCHAGWLSSAAFRALARPHHPGHLDEDDWFPIYTHLSDLSEDPRLVHGSIDAAMSDAAAKGVVGIVDMEFESGRTAWPWRTWAGLDRLRVRTCTYPEGLEDVIAAGARTGDVLDEAGMVTMGPLKIISDGSLNTRTAWCCEPFLTDTTLGDPRGKQNVDRQELTELLTRARANGLIGAVHAIGDAALVDAVAAFAATGARGSIEHAQLVRREVLPQMAELGLVASVQPAHLLDDRDSTEDLWSDRLDRCFALRWMTDAGVPLRLGSDAPVAPLDPWLAMAAAVHRSADEREPWAPEQALSPQEALEASTDGITSIEVGGPGDLVLLDEDPTPPSLRSTAEQAAHLRAMRPLATIVGGRITHG
ncbi:amidohydrolase [Janibacter alittae]|uniref:Amidohydrolase family protein n=1 Tax=Janibacter alittae TaxID=3115209 RepID=A0ABZ2MGM0_9MICO